MFDGTTFKIDGLLAELSSVYEADVGDVGHGLKGSPHPGARDRERDPEILQWIADAQAGDERAFEKLRNRGTPLVKAAISKKVSDAARADRDAREDLEQEIWIKLHQYIIRTDDKRFDPKKAKFTSWVTAIASLIADRWSKSREIAYASGREPGELGQEFEKSVSAKQVTHAAEFTHEEEALAKDMHDYLEDLKTEKIPFPAKITARAFSGESVDDARKRVKAMYVDLFRDYYGLCVPRVDGTTLVKRYPLPGDKPGDPPKPMTRRNLTSWYLKKLKEDILAKRYREKGQEKVFAELMNKLMPSVRRQRRTTEVPTVSCEDHLWALLDSLEELNAPAYA